MSQKERDALEIWLDDYLVKHLEYKAPGQMAYEIAEHVYPAEKAAPDSVLREAVKAFADWMETRLSQNDDKDGWDSCTERFLLDSAASNLRQARYEKDMQYKVEALVDCANFCMMAYDNLKRKLALQSPAPQTTKETT